MAKEPEKQSLPNIKALKPFRLKGSSVSEGTVLPKSAFSKKDDWLNLCNMSPAKCAQTDEAIGEPKAPSPKGKGGAMPQPAG